MRQNNRVIIRTALKRLGVLALGAALLCGLSACGKQESGKEQDAVQPATAVSAGSGEEFTKDTELPEMEIPIEPASQETGEKAQTSDTAEDDTGNGDSQTSSGSGQGGSAADNQASSGTGQTDSDADKQESAGTQTDTVSPDEAQDASENTDSAQSGANGNDIIVYDNGDILLPEVPSTNR